MDARDEVLDRVRRAVAVGPTGPVDVPRDYRTAGEHAPGSPVLVDLLVDRLEDYKAVVHRCPMADVPAAVARVLDGRGLRRVVVPSGLDPGWTAGWTGECVVDDADAPRSVADLDAVDGVVTACAVAVAETGTFVLDGSPDCGRRAVSLVPDQHLVVIRLDQVVQTVGEALTRLDPHRPLTWVSGPSATSDIELSRVEGVHGPRRLDVLLVG